MKVVSVWLLLVAVLSGLPASVAGTAGASWDLNQYKYRLLLQVGAAGYERLDKPVEVEMDFSQLLARVGRSDYVDPANLALLELGPAGGVPIAFQFDRGNDFHPWTDARGTMTFIMTGQTATEAERRFYVYFGLRGFAPAPDIPLLPRPVSVASVSDHEGQESFCIRAPHATYYYHRFGAGFASLEDEDGNDWLGYDPGVGPVSNSGSGGKYRGTPNMGHPEGYCHPGDAVSDSRVVAEGPVKVTIESQSNDGKMHCRWDVFPNCARMTVVRMRAPYWYLYEGTPGGKLDMDTDICARPDGTGFAKTTVSEKWESDIPARAGLEWLYFADPGVQRSLFLVHHEDDEEIDSYWPMNEEMTVFGFGRLGLKKFMEGTPRHFTIGLCNHTEPDEVCAAVNRVCQPLTVSLGPLEESKDE